MAFALVGAIKHLRLFHSIFNLDRKVETFHGILFLRDALLRYDGLFDSLKLVPPNYAPRLPSLRLIPPDQDKEPKAKMAAEESDG
ncbi:hypothetical protein Tco_0605391 [Tanacetum coccineum]